MARQNFTTARVKSLQCEPGKQQTLYGDAKTPGLGLRVTASGARAYIFESRLFGKTLRLTIGDTRTWSLGQARTEAARLKTLVDDGRDPREMRVEQQAAHEARRAETLRRSVTFGEAWDIYVEARKPFWGQLHYKNHVYHANPGGKNGARA